MLDLPNNQVFRFFFSSSSRANVLQKIHNLPLRKSSLIFNIVLLMKIHFFTNFPKPNGVSDAFPKGPRNKSLVIFVTEPSLIGWFLYSIFIENSKLLANQTGCGRVRTVFTMDVFDAGTRLKLESCLKVSIVLRFQSC